MTLSGVEWVRVPSEVEGQAIPSLRPPLSLSVSCGENRFGISCAESRSPIQRVRGAESRAGPQPARSSSGLLAASTTGCL